MKRSVDENGGFALRTFFAGYFMDILFSCACSVSRRFSFGYENAVVNEEIGI